jgi:hypothetical protein
LGNTIIVLTLSLGRTTLAIPNAYLATTKNLEAFLNAIQSARAPERFTNKFLTQLDFASSNDRLFIALLKMLGMIDEGGVPTKRYYEFLDQGQAGRILADAVREAYSDLFAINKNAQNLSVEDVKNKLRTLTLGQKSENVINLMANTFKALCSLADWDAPAPEVPATTPLASTTTTAEPPITTPPPVPPVPPLAPPTLTSDTSLNRPLQLHYDIQIHLPESRDPAVFDAIFQALRKHLV